MTSDSSLLSLILLVFQEWEIHFTPVVRMFSQQRFLGTVESFQRGVDSFQGKVKSFREGGYLNKGSPLLPWPTLDLAGMQRHRRQGDPPVAPTNRMHEWQK
jgi:hypothetical protein